MATSHLATYLNDHLAGSKAALELLAHLEQTHAGSSIGRFAAELSADIAADRGELEALMARLQIAASGPRKTAAWMAEKMAEFKLWLDDSAAGTFRLFEATEAVSLGIEGKRLLWCALGAAAKDMPELGGVDYGRLEQRAREQRLRVEAVRLEAVRVALGGPPSAGPRSGL